MGINSVNGDTLLQSGMFPPCRVAATSKITLSGLQTIDSIAVNAGDRVLVVGQTDLTQNGIYAASSGNWKRTTDAQSNIQLFQGMTVMVALGTAHGLTLYELNSPSDPVVIGTSAIVFQAISAPTPSVGSLFYTAPYAGAVAQTQGAYNAQRVSVLDFGADLTGAADATNAFNNALTAAALLGKKCYAPAGRYQIAGSINIGGNGTCLEGDGILSTVLFSPSASNPIIVVGNGLSGIRLSGFQLNRSVTATAGGDGIAWAIGWITDGFLDNIWARNQYTGFHLGPTALGYGENLRAETCVTYGVLQSNNAAWGGNQWTMTNVYCGNNGVDGYAMRSDPSAVQGMGTGVMTNIYSFANVGHGFAAVGTAASPINSLRIFQFFFGQDNASELYLDTHGGDHQIANGFVELAGTAQVGPSSTVAPSGLGHGVEITGNNVDVMINGVLANGMAQSGIVTAATGFTLINGCFSNNNSNYGVVIFDGTKATLACSWFTGNTIGPLFVTTNSGSLQAIGNTPTSVNGGSTMTTNTNQTVSGVKTFLSGTILLAGGTSGQTSIQPDLVASGSWTIPASVDRFVGRATADTFTGVKTFAQNALALAGGTSGATLLNGVSGAASGTWTFPAATDTVVGRGTTETITGVKTFAVGALKLANAISGSMQLTGASTANGSIALPDVGTDILVGLAATQTLTNKSLDGATLATKLVKGVYILGASAIQSSHTGDTIETTLAAVTVPAGVMGLNGIIRITVVPSASGAGGTRSWQIKFGGTAFVTSLANASTVTGGRFQGQFANRGAANSQIGASLIQANFGAGSLVDNTMAIDTTVSQNIVITGQLGSAGDAISIESYLVELILP